MTELPDLAQRVTAALEFEPRINLHRFPIDVKPGAGRLVLQGNVENVASKRLAARIAGDLASDEHPVADALEVVPAAARADGDLLDAFTRALLELAELKPLTIRRRHRDQLETLRTAPASETPGEIEFGVSQGVVELAGTVPSLSHRRVVEVLAWWLGGCRNVVNQLRVEPPERDGDDELAEAVQLVLEIDPSLPKSQPLGVEVAMGVVTLRGALPDAARRQRAEHDAWCVDGVREVRNEIELFS